MQYIKGELHPGNDVRSVDEEKYNDQTVKILAKSNNPFKSYIFSKLLFPPMLSILELACV